MIKVEEWILEEKEIRTAHLDLEDACLERGGDSTSCRGVLAQYLNTDIPKGAKRIDLCHACHNDKCSNPKHLYWGTRKENARDYMDNGGRSVWQKMVDKYGEDGARQLNIRSKTAAARAGSANKGKPKSEEHKKRISESLRQKAIDRKNKSATT